MGGRIHRNAGYEMPLQADAGFILRTYDGVRLAGHCFLHPSLILMMPLERQKQNSDLNVMAVLDNRLCFQNLLNQKAIHWKERRAPGIRNLASASLHVSI